MAKKAKAKKAASKTARAKKTAKGGRAKQAARRTKARGGKDELMQRLKQYVRAHAEGFLTDANITSIGIGYKKTDGKETPQLAVQFSVESKVRPEDISSLGSKKIPDTLDIGGGVTVPTDVIERSYKPSFRVVEAEAKDARKSRLDVVRPGASVGNAALGGAGTLGTLVQDTLNNNTVMLSNWHVFHGAVGKIGDDIVQPGKFDDNQADKNLVGKLLRSHLGPAGDCAISSISGRSFSNEVIEVGVSISQIGEPELKDRVAKSGRTTGVTFGLVSRVEVNTKITYTGGVTATVGGFEIEPDPERPAQNNEISRGGDSGSCWVGCDKTGKPTGIMLGLHFAGDDDDGGPSEIALACYAKSVMNKLEIAPIGAIAPQAVAEGVEELRQGFDQNFLSFGVGAPKFTRVRQDDLAKLDGDAEIKYCHFSVWLSKERRYPVCVAWNIDGSQFKRLNRVNFRTERRGDLEQYQLTNDIYVSNDLDKGHIARRADLCWGTRTVAKQGNYDSFFYTNIAPQHAAFNQSDDTSSDPEGGVWGRLENTVFDSEDPHDLRVSLMGGPVFSRRDRKFSQNGEECFLPREYWKVVAYEDDRDNKKKVFAFLLTQASLIEGLVRPQGLDFDDWLWARITLQDLQEKTGVIFPRGMKDNEVPFVKPQSLGPTGPQLRPLFSSEDYFAS